MFCRDYRYLRFILPGFIFLSGFLITNILFINYGEDLLSLSFKLISKGIKLVLLFTSLNIVIGLAFQFDTYGRELGTDYFFNNALSIYFSSYRKLSVFSIVLMIGYLYILAPAVLWINQYFKYFLPFLSIGLTTFITVYSLNMVKFHSKLCVWRGGSWEWL